MSATRRFVIALLAGTIGFIAGWHVAIDRIPYLATDALFAGMKKAGARTNVLGKPVIRTAKGNLVPMANADTLVRSAMIDVSEGPLLFTGTPPGKLAEYWSVSVYAHNTDTLFVLNDQQVPPGRPVRIQLRIAGQKPPAAGIHDVVLPSPKAFLLVRPTMANREDKPAVAALAAALAEHRLEPVR